MNKITPFTSLILAIWMAMLLVASTLTLVTTTDDISPYYEQMTEASQLASVAMNAVKQRKIALGIGVSAEDILDTGMIGASELTSITTTEGILEAKRTTCNPNWSAVVISMFVRGGLRSGDEIGLVFSGSFPAMNICVMAAAQAFGLNTCIMASVGASYYGANQVELTFFDMAMYLYEQGIFEHKLDYMSLGGADDIGSDFRSTEDTQAIIGRIKSAEVALIYERDFGTNIDLRLEYFEKETPNIKMLINVGGSLVGFGTGPAAFISSGYFSAPRYPRTDSSIIKKKSSDYGLLQCMRLKGLPVASFINIRGLAETYSMPYDPSVMPEIGVGREYYSKSYNLIVPLIALGLSVAVAVFYVIYRRTSSIQRSKNERNYIIRRR